MATRSRGQISYRSSSNHQFAAQCKGHIRQRDALDMFEWIWIWILPFARSPCRWWITGRASFALQVICPTGKSVKSRQAPFAKIFLFFRSANQAISTLSCPERGALAIVTNVGGGMRWTLMVPETRVPDADGEVVWS